jgi:hypothetical protein
MPDSVDHQLRRDVREVAGMVARVQQEIGHVSSELSSVAVVQQQTASDLAQLRADFVNFIQQSERRANLQRAETKIGVLQDKLEIDFGHHKVVRRTAVGLLQAFDLGIVSEEAVRAVTEELMIQTPRYWLAPALVALSAWSGNEPDLCERAIAEAYRRSPSKTSLLFMLILRRQNRQESSVRWLRHYLLAQDPTALGRDFAVILEAVAQGGFGPGGRATVDQTLASWTQALSDDASHAAQVSRWRAEVDALRAQDASRDFPALAAVCPQWPQLAHGLSGAEGHQKLLDKYRALMDEVVEGHDRIEDAMDDILDRLVRDFDNDELPLHRELAYNEAVVAHDGDEHAARKVADLDSVAHEETLDYLSIQTQSALNPAAIGVSRATQKVAIASCRAWFGQAHADATRAYQGQLPLDIGVQFAGSHNLGAKTFQLPDWRGSFKDGLPQLEQSLAAHWDFHTAAFISSLAFPVARKTILPALVVLAIVIIGVAAGGPGGLVFGLVVGAIWAFVLYRQYQQSLVAQQQAAQMLAHWKQESITQLRNASAEVTEWTVRFGKAHAQAQEAQAFIASLETATSSTTRFERRTIDPTGGEQ